MSRIAPLILLAASTPLSAGISAEQAIANYRAIITTAPEEGNMATGCLPGHESEIVVCGHLKRPPPRLPMPDDRFEAGEVVHHLGEPKRAAEALNTQGACQINCGPPAAPETWRRLFSILSGKDPD